MPKKYPLPSFLLSDKFYNEVIFTTHCVEGSRVKDFE